MGKIGDPGSVLDLSEIELLLRARKAEYEKNNQKAEVVLKAKKTPSGERTERKLRTPRPKRTRGEDGTTGAILYQIQDTKRKTVYWITGVGSVEKEVDRLGAENLVGWQGGEGTPYQILVNASRPAGFIKLAWHPTDSFDRLEYKIAGSVRHLFKIDHLPLVNGIQVSLIPKEGRDENEGQPPVRWDRADRGEADTLAGLAARGERIVKWADTTHGGVEEVLSAIETMMSATFSQDTKTLVLERMLSRRCRSCRPGWGDTNATISIEAIQLTLHGEEVHFGLRPEEW